MAIYEYIARDSQLYAKRTADKLTRCTEKLADFPKMGRKVKEYDADEIREIFEGQYRIIYRIKPKQIDILAVIHGARLLPDTIE